MQNNSIFRKREKPKTPEVEVRGDEIVIQKEDGEQKLVKVPETTWQ